MRTCYRPSIIEAFRGKCSNCTAKYADGRSDCLHRDCPLYFYMPYRNNIPEISPWIFGKFTTKHIIRAKKLGIKNSKIYVKKVLIKNSKLKISKIEIVRAKCFRCMGDFNIKGDDKISRYDCENRDCSIYYWMPYRQFEPLYNWMFDEVHTKKHREQLIITGMTRKEYIEKLGHEQGIKNWVYNEKISIPSSCEKTNIQTIS